MTQEPAPVAHKAEPMPSAWTRELLGEVAVRRGLVTPTMLNEALDLQFATGCQIGDALLGLGYLLDTPLTALLAEQMKRPCVAVEFLGFSPGQLNEIPGGDGPQASRAAPPARWQAAGRSDGRSQESGCAPGADLLHRLQDLPGLRARTRIIEAIDRFHPRHLEGANALMVTGTTETVDPFQINGGRASVLDATQYMDAPVIQLLNLIMRKAIQLGASDIHIEPGIEEGTVRFRLNGLPADQLKVPNQLHTALISSLKILDRMDIAERRLPQDGSVRVTLEGREADLRRSTTPFPCARARRRPSASWTPRAATSNWRTSASPPRTCPGWTSSSTATSA